MAKLRFDNLPMDRQVAGHARADPGRSGSILGPPGLKALFEKRDVDPESTFLKRRYGSQRTTNTAPNLIGITAEVNKGRVDVDSDFTSAAARWTIFGTVRTSQNVEDGSYPLFQFRNVAEVAESFHCYIVYEAAGNIQAG